MSRFIIEFLGRGRWRRRECITPVRHITVREKDEVKQLKAILLGISSEIEVLQNLVDRFPSCEVQLRGLRRGRFLCTEGRAPQPESAACAG